MGDTDTTPETVAPTGPPTGPRRFLKPVLIAWAILAVVLSLTVLGQPGGPFYPDGDDALRMIQVRALVDGQGWFDLTQYRIDPVAPVEMHWSRLVDAPLAALVVILQPLLGETGAERVTAFAMPLLVLLGIMIPLGHLAYRRLGAEGAGLSALAFSALPLLVQQNQPMRIDHHGWQILLVAIALWGVFDTRRLRGAGLAGFAMAWGLAVSIELLPISALFAALLALRWLRNHELRAQLVAYMAALAGGLAVLQIVTQGLSPAQLYCDAITWPHIGLFAVAALGCGVLARLRPLPWYATAAGLGLAGLAGLAVFALSSPACLAPPFADLDPLVRAYWYVNVKEGQPIWRHGWEQWFIVGHLIVILGVLYRLWQRSEGALKTEWGEHLLLAAGGVLAGIMVWRSIAFASVFAAIPLGYLLLRVFRAARAEKGLATFFRQATIPLAIVFFGTLPPMIIQKARAVEAPATEAASDVPQRYDLPLARAKLATLTTSSCELSTLGPALRPLGNATLLAPLDIGPMLMTGSDINVVATAHHRADRAMHDVILAFGSNADIARWVAGKHRADYVVLCADLSEPSLYVAKRGAETLAARLAAGDPPDWLERVELDGVPASFTVWRVRD